MMVISVVSSGFNGTNKAKISLNDEEISCEKNVNSHYRGLHLVHVRSGKVVTAQVYDTYASSVEIEKFIDLENHFEMGDLIIVACKDECRQNLSEKTKIWFTQMGSHYINGLIFRSAFIFIA